MTLAIILAVIAGVAVVLYACLRISARCDDADEQLFRIRRS